MTTIRSIDKQNGESYKYMYDSSRGIACVIQGRGEFINRQSSYYAGYTAEDEIEEINNMSDKQFRLFCRNSLKYN